MNDTPRPPVSLSPDDVRHLAGRVVLVKSARDRRNPETAMRGWIEVHEEPGREPEVRIALEFPQMFQMRAHRRTIPLDHAAVMRLLDNDYNGVFEYTLEDELQ